MCCESPLANRACNGLVYITCIHIHPCVLQPKLSTAAMTPGVAPEPSLGINKP